MIGGEREKTYKKYFPPTSQKTYKYAARDQSLKPTPGRPKGVEKGIYDREFEAAYKSAWNKGGKFINQEHRKEFCDAVAREAAYTRSIEQQVSKDLHAISFMVTNKQGIISGGPEVRKAALRALGYHDDVIRAIKGAHPNYRIPINIEKQITQVRKNVEAAKSQKTYRALGTHSFPQRFRPFTPGITREKKTTTRPTPEVRVEKQFKGLGVGISAQKTRVIQKPITRPPSQDGYHTSIPRPLPAPQIPQTNISITVPRKFRPI